MFANESCLFLSGESNHARMTSQFQTVNSSDGQTVTIEWNKFDAF